MRRVIVIVAILALLAVVGYFLFDRFFIGDNAPVTVGTPVITSQFGDIKTKAKTAAPTSTNSAYNAADGIQLVAYVPVQPAEPVNQQQPYKSCVEQRGATATPAGVAAQATAAATAAAAEAAATPGEPDFIVLSIVAEESEACYQVGELFVDQNNKFNLAIGVTKAIAGEIAIDRANLANSKVGDIVVSIDQLKSDSGQRDRAIRGRWIETSKYPEVKLTNAKVVGLPARPAKDGEVVTFQIVGTMQVRDVQKELTWDVSASLSNGTLIGTATTDVKMTDFKFDPPEILGMIKANNDAHLILNFVAREPDAAAAATAAK